MRKKMIDDLKVLGLLLIMATASAFVRFKSFTQFMTDAVLGFVMGYSFYLLLGHWIADGATRSGFCGIIILCSRPLYDWLNTFIRDKLSELIDKKVK